MKSSFLCNDIILKASSDPRIISYPTKNDLSSVLKNLNDDVLSATNEFTNCLNNIIDVDIATNFIFVKPFINYIKSYISNNNSKIISLIIEQVYVIKYDPIRFDLINQNYDVLNDQFVIDILSTAIDSKIKAIFDLKKVWSSLDKNKKKMIYDKVNHLLFYTDIIFYDISVIDHINKLNPH